MKVAKKLVLMLCLLLPATFCLANDTDGTQKQEDGATIVLKKKTGNTTPNKDDISFSASIDGHTLSINFAQNIGSVLVEISDGQSFMVVTPDNVQTYITASGSYTVTFTLSNGDEYYGNFVVF